MMDRKREEQTIDELIAAGKINPDKFGFPDHGLIVTAPPEGDTTEVDYKDHKFTSDD